MSTDDAGVARAWVRRCDRIDEDLPDRKFELRKGGTRIGRGFAWSNDDPTSPRDDVIEIARSLARPGR